MNLSSIRRNWERFGNDDPFWAILTHPDKQGNKWQEKEFFSLGEEEVEYFVQLISKWNPSHKLTRALDFGCGVGRLTYPLSKYYKEVIGIDIAKSMILKARQFNYQRSCQFIHNARSDLKIFHGRSFDLVLSRLTLQHMPPVCMRKYIKEFHRILDVAGVCLFQLPDTDLPDEQPAEETEPRMEMHGTPKQKMVNFLQSIGFRVLLILEDDPITNEVSSYIYLLRKERFSVWIRMKVLRLIRGKRVDGSEIADLTRSQIDLGWFGSFSMCNFPWITHKGLGFLYVQWESENSIWAWSPSMGWIWTGRHEYPNIFRASDQAWLWYQVDTLTPIRCFFNYVTGLWEFGLQNSALDYYSANIKGDIKQLITPPI